MRRTTLPLAALGFLVALSIASPSEAGIVIKNDGSVYIGRIEPESFKDTKGEVCSKEDYDSITMKSPRKDKGQPAIRNEMVFYKDEIRRRRRTSMPSRLRSS